MGQNIMQKIQKDIIYHKMIQRLTRRSAVISQILGLTTSDSDPSLWTQELQEYYNSVNNGLSFDFQNLINAIQQLDDLTGEPTIIEIGEINYTHLNSATLGATEIDFVFVDKKPADKYIVDLFFVNTSEFVNDNLYYGYTQNTISDIFLKKNTGGPLISSQGTKLPQSVVDNVTVQVVLSDENEQDWTGGSLKVFAEVKTYPTLA